mmetsp:Transcript_36225/g.67255  ORF Transcript_36225/g.67255 Transcript_36225/m.67255 type:complete len:234 (+) Transcript_36225:1655-2356(+)
MHRFLPRVHILAVVGVIGRLPSSIVRHDLYAGGTVRPLNLPLDVFDGILHENGTVRIALAHLLLPLLQTVEHVMTQYDRLETLFCRIAVLSREHVHLPLIHSQLTNVRLQEEDVGALHEGIEDLRGRETSLETTHDLTALFDARDVESTCDVEHDGPVNVGILCDLLAGPSEFDVGEIHAGRLPYFDEVLTDRYDFGQIAAHFVVHEGEPVGDPEAEGGVRSGGRAFVHVDGF